VALIYGKDTTEQGASGNMIGSFPYIHIIKYKHSNHFYSEILIQDANTHIARANLQKLLPNNWVVSEVSRRISVIKENY
jgi:hypothetical protein